MQRDLEVGEMASQNTKWKLQAALYTNKNWQMDVVVKPLGMDEKLDPHKDIPSNL